MKVIANGAFRGRKGADGKYHQNLEVRNDGVINAITTVWKDNVIIEIEKEQENMELGNSVLIGKRIRKLTPRECFALQGFRKEDADMLSENGISNTQLYKQAGNSICVPVLEAIFKAMDEQGILYA